MNTNTPSWSVGKMQVERGKCLPFGTTELKQGINFSLFSQHATAATLVLYRMDCHTVYAEIPLHPDLNRTGHVWHIMVHDLDSSYSYGWRIDGPFQPEKGDRFDPNLILIDPYARALSCGTVWGEPNNHHRFCCLPDENFDWQGDAPPLIPIEDTIIYELHVRGYTVDPSSGVEHPGTYLGLTEKIPYLKSLGITAVELMPVFEFDENEHMRRHPQTGELLRNLWGYSPIVFFAPKASFAHNGRAGNQVTEFKEMVKAFHDAGIEVILDVVYNHTAEGDERGTPLSFKGIDNKVFYILDKEGNYKNFSGCGNTVNCNHPQVRSLIIDSLRYWVAEMHVDGFRFDLASILGRGPEGEVLQNPPLIERIAVDPVLADTKIIAEAWDAAGLNQVGSFPSWGRWAEWNGYYRDHVRRFWRGEPGMISLLASRICGSEDLYFKSGENPFNSINFITSHDGYTLHDLVSYKQKYNEDNGEYNRDGENNNYSINFGVEGPSDDANINSKRKQQIKNFAATLMLSQGVPMILGGDEFCRSQKGNNNAYCQDNEISWLNWHMLEQHKDMHRFFQLIIAFRKRHPSLRRKDFFRGGAGISWHGTKAYAPDWSHDAKWMAFLLEGQTECNIKDQDIFVMINSADHWFHFEVPKVGREWRRVIDTAQASPEDIFAHETEAPSVGWARKHYGLGPKSLVVLVAV